MEYLEMKKRYPEMFDYDKIFAGALNSLQNDNKLDYVLENLRIRHNSDCEPHGCSVSRIHKIKVTKAYKEILLHVPQEYYSKGIDLDGVGKALYSLDLTVELACKFILLRSII